MERLMSLTFLCATYNEEDEIEDVLSSVYAFVDKYAIADDGSTDRTVEILNRWSDSDDKPLTYAVLEHIGLPETVKNVALGLVDTEWVLMLDCDERINPGTLEEITRWLQSEESSKVDYVYFNQLEIIDGEEVRAFQKCKLFRAKSIRFPLNNIHADDQFVGEGAYYGWRVFHRKSSEKQQRREIEYLQTYKKLLTEGKIDEGRYSWLVGLHHYVKPH
jgi:glycosyltransferase involved in cell wall biosynthesis